MTFILGAKSIATLAPAHPALKRVVHSAINHTKVDFSVHDCLRTLEEQKENVANGVSWTLDSKHLVQPDGFVHAVDLVPYVKGKLRWDWPLCFKIAEAMQDAAGSYGVSLTWGGVWDRSLLDLGANLEHAVADYVARRAALGKRANIDGPHFELRF